MQTDLVWCSLELIISVSEMNQQTIQAKHDRLIEGILLIGPYPPCLRMAGRALLAGYPCNNHDCNERINLKQLGVLFPYRAHIWVFRVFICRN